MKKQIMKLINNEYLPVIEEVPDEEIPYIEDTRTYEAKVVAKIREKYSADDEYAILRKKLAGIDNGEFDEYNSYVENIKAELKQ